MPHATNEIRISATNPHFAFFFIVLFRLNGTRVYYKKNARIGHFSNFFVTIV